MVIPTITYSKMVLVVVGTKIINKALRLMTMGELAKATMTWRQAHFGAVMSGSLQLSCRGSDKSEIGERAKCSPKGSDPVEVQKIQLDEVKGLVTPHRRSLFCPLAPSMCRPISVLGDTACRLMSSLNWHSVPGCQQQQYLQLLMGNYVLVPQEYQSACTT